MHIHNLSDKASILNQYLLEIRDKTIQKDTMRFRRNLERIANILGYELSKSLEYKNQPITTPLEETSAKKLSETLVICSVLRAGLPLHQGLLQVFDRSENAFISAFRHPAEIERGFEIITDYVATPKLEGKTLILADPMLATGDSLVATYNSLLRFGIPKQIHVVCVIGSSYGVDHINSTLPEASHLWIADVDPQLNDKSYIVPGLGDAGDLAFGSKL